ncbi:YceI family protein [Desertivirga arenae]|uniref:YceI family protein n=1 Tax=Desertivirga arenae TaxID=2810309 RepID=UPI001A96E909|nr:YceI family protein [Pedobacter sp. SYSU D00823]
MKKLTLFSAAGIGLALLSFRFADATWNLDKSHAKLGFSVSHMMVSDVEGSFKKFDATVKSTKDDFSDASVELSAETNSVDTDNDQRDAHVKNADFLDTEKFPTLSFKSTSVKKVADKKYKVKGNLTLHGVTKPVELNATANIGVNPMNKKTISGWKVSGVIKRSDFGIGAKVPSAVVGDDVTLNANAEFVKN